MKWSLQNYVHDKTTVLSWAPSMCKNLLQSDDQQWNYSKAEFPSNLNFEQKSLLKRASGPGCVQCEVIYLYYQVEAEAELRGWQEFRGWAPIRSHAETTDHSQKLASALVCRWRRSGHLTRSLARLIPYIFLNNKPKLACFQHRIFNKLD